MPSSSALGPRRGVRRLIPALLAGVLALAGCGVQSGGSAATVGSASISDQGVRDVVESVVAEVNAQGPGRTIDREYLSRLVLTTQIRQQLARHASDVTGVRITDAELSGQLAQGGGQLSGVLQVPDALVRDALMTALTAMKLVEFNAQQQRPITEVRVTADLLQDFADRADALRARERFIADPAAFDQALAAAGEQSGRKGLQLSSLTQPGAGSLGLFVAPAGSVVLLQNGEETVLVRIVNRAVGQTTNLASTISEAQQSPNGQSAAVGISLLALQPYAKDLAISVNPRYGTWDPTTLQVVPGNLGT